MRGGWISGPMMDNKMIFFGAGSSNYLGVPTMTAFTDEFRKYISKSRFGLCKYHDDMIGFLKREYLPSADLEGIYTIVDAIANESDPLDIYSSYYFNSIDKTIIKKKHKIDLDKNRRYYTFLNWYIRDRCWVDPAKEEKILNIFNKWIGKISLTDTISKCNKNGQKMSQTYYNPSQFNISTTSAGPSRLPPLYLITTNYDNVLENYLGYILKSEYYDGFIQTGTRKILDFSTINMAENNNKMFLLKIHGSIDWYQLSNNSIVRTSDPNTRSFDGFEVVKEIVIFPAQNKYLYYDKFLELLFYFKMILKSSTMWFFIGYSFRDEILLDIINTEWNNDKVAFIISPNASKKVELFNGNNENIHPIEGKWNYNKTFDKFEKKLNDLKQ